MICFRGVPTASNRCWARPNRSRPCQWRRIGSAVCGCDGGVSAIVDGDNCAGIEPVSGSTSKTQQTVVRSTEGVQPPYALEVRVAYAVDKPAIPTFMLTRDSGTLRDQSDANRSPAAEIEGLPARGDAGAVRCGGAPGARRGDRGALRARLRLSGRHREHVPGGAGDGLRRAPSGQRRHRWRAARALSGVHVEAARPAGQPAARRRAGRQL